MSTLEKQDERTPLQNELAAFAIFAVVSGATIAHKFLEIDPDSDELTKLLESSDAADLRQAWQKLEAVERRNYRIMSAGLRRILDTKKVKHLKTSVAALEVRPVAQAYDLSAELAQG